MILAFSRKRMKVLKVQTQSSLSKTRMTARKMFELKCQGIFEATLQAKTLEHDFTIPSQKIEHFESSNPK